jgi:hypothetical protein
MACLELARQHCITTMLIGHYSMQSAMLKSAGQPIRSMELITTNTGQYTFQTLYRKDDGTANANIELLKALYRAQRDKLFIAIMDCDGDIDGVGAAYQFIQAETGNYQISYTTSKPVQGLVQVNWTARLAEFFSRIISTNTNAQAARTRFAAL